MAHFYLKREAEVVLAKPLHWNGLLRADKGAVSSAIAASYQALVNKYREDFFRDVSKDEEIRKKASAWYKTAYGKGATKQVCRHYSWQCIIPFKVESCVTSWGFYRNMVQLPFSALAKHLLE